MILLKLAVSNFLAHKVRAALTVSAIALSVSLVVSVTSGYASMEAAVYKYLSQYMGATDVEITRQNGNTSDVVVSEFRKDPDVLRVDGRFETGGSATVQGRPKAKGVTLIGVRRPEDKNSDYLTMVKGSWFDTPNGNVAVIDDSLSEALHVSVGDEIILPTPDPNAPPPSIIESITGGAASTQATTEPIVGLHVKVVGIVHKPAIIATFMTTAYLPIETVQQYSGVYGKVTRVLVDTKPQIDLDAFAARWTTKLATLDPNLKMRTSRETRRQMDKNLLGIHVLSYLGGTVSMLAATFIVFSALSMGVTERQRTLAMLRAVGAVRFQIALLVLFEGLTLAVVGVAVGVPLGWLWINILARMYDDVFSAGAVASWGGILFGSLGAIATAVAASLLPAWNATRVGPLEAMSPQAAPLRTGPPWRVALCGLVLISIDPFLFFGPMERIVQMFGEAEPAETAREVKFIVHFAAGLPGLMIGFFLLSPMFVWVAERVLGPIVAAMFGLRFSMLRQQLTSGIWRVAGTCAALMVGLAVLIVMQTNGQTAMRGWKLPDRFPDVFISGTSRSGLTFEQQAKLAQVPGIRPGEIMPIGIASPQFGSNLFQLGAHLALIPDATMFIAVPPDKAFKMMELEFKEGSAAEAELLLAMKEPKDRKNPQPGEDPNAPYILVTEEFRQLKGLGKGKTLPLKTNKGVKQFTIAGVIWSPGIDVMVTMFDMGKQFDQRTAASVFGSLDVGREYFGIDQVYLFGANLDWNVDKEVLLKDVQQRLGAQGLRAGDVRHIKTNIQLGFQRLLLLVSTVAFAAMAVASLGVTNTIMASIRSRQWQFGILRSIGVTRSQLLRLVLAEATLIGLVGCALGLCAGFEMSVDANQLSQVVTGYHPPMFIPWPIIWIGVGIVMVISLLASLWPAASVARSEPLTLLQAGRAAG